jgi:sulfur carrier protein ThiS
MNAAGVGSAPPALPRTIRVRVEVARGALSPERWVELREGAVARDAVRAAGESPEGSAVLRDGTPIPLDEPMIEGTLLTVVPTFSGG